ncbi:Hsp20/alpha crystallin family protein [Halosegnis longus]|uniref:Hsp20/alpha crystallin family protein n=1 Tax=Halosegnis longus TaxID=2216012 RepID=A0AAJ4RAP7_9EURY|nr:MULTISPECIES: Hsp20/alpha crystallin family protein [Halobacteriales]RNJ27400.1 Hsp20/alpha crystallin family protein [Salella cibi]
MRRDDRDDPFDDIFSEIERMMEEMTGENVDISARSSDAGFGADAHFSVYEEGDTIRVVGDLPGIEKDDIDIRCDGQTLTVAADTAHRQYEEHLDLPARVDEHTASASFNNGVLDVTLERLDTSADIGLE